MMIIPKIVTESEERGLITLDDQCQIYESAINFSEKVTIVYLEICILNVNIIYF